MKKVIIILLGVLLMSACATLTPEEKAARKEAAMESVKRSVKTQKYRININSVKPMRGIDHTISGPWLRVDTTTVECYLPYAGLDDIPHLKSRTEFRLSSKIEIKSEIRDYQVGFDPAEHCYLISFKADDHGFECEFNIIIEDTGTARIHLQPEKRDYIDYTGHLVTSKK